MAKIAELDGYDPVAEGEQDENGVDLLAIRHNLQLTVAQRLEQHRSALASVIWLRNGISAARSAKNHSSTG